MNKIDEFLSQVSVIDTETTHIDVLKAEIIEIAGGAYVDGAWAVRSKMFKSMDPIPPEASAIHYISNRMIANEPLFAKAVAEGAAVLGLGKYHYMVAHNSDYDQKVLDNNFSKAFSWDDWKDYETRDRWICTWRLAKAVIGVNYDEVKSFGLGYLRYYLELDVPDDLPAHRADADVTTCGRLLEKLIELGIDNGKLDPEEDLGPQIHELCWGPIYIPQWKFGKHKGKLLEEIPTDYYMWAIQNMDVLNDENQNFDSDLAYSVEKVLTDRGAL
jgi:DNA polymerase III epsilon subunit-like protein